MTHDSGFYKKAKMEKLLRDRVLAAPRIGGKVEQLGFVIEENQSISRSEHVYSFRGVIK